MRKKILLGIAAALIIIAGVVIVIIVSKHGNTPEDTQNFAESTSGYISDDKNTENIEDAESSATAESASSSEQQDSNMPDPSDQDETAESIDVPVVIENEGDIEIIIPDDMEQDGF